MPYSFFEHTADLGLQAEAKDLDTLFEQAALGLTASLVADPDQVTPQESQTFEIQGDPADPEDLLVDWLSELLYRFNVDGFIGSRFEPQVTGTGGLQARVSGEAYDPELHGAGQELKAVTYHGLVVEQRGELWLARVVIDL